MLYYQYTIIISIATTKIHKIRTWSKIPIIIYNTPHIICLHTLSHTPQRQTRTELKTSTENHSNSCHTHKLLRSGKTRHYQHSMGVLMAATGYIWSIFLQIEVIEMAAGSKRKKYFCWYISCTTPYNHLQIKITTCGSIRQGIRITVQT